MMSANLAARMVHCASLALRHDVSTDCKVLQITLPANGLTLSSQLEGTMSSLQANGRLVREEILTF